MKNESDLTNKFNPKYKLEVENFRNRIMSEIQKHDLEIANKQLLVTTLQNHKEENCVKIKELQNQLRFCEARVLKYEAMLLSV